MAAARWTKLVFNAMTSPLSALESCPTRELFMRPALRAKLTALALEAFKALLTHQPDVELGLGDTSPRVLSVLDRAKRALSEPKNRAVRMPVPTPVKP